MYGPGKLPGSGREEAERGWMRPKYVEIGFPKQGIGTVF